MQRRPVLLIAASGLARETLSAIDADVIGFLDDDPTLHGTSVGGSPVLGGLDEIVNHPDAAVVVCAGSGAARASIVDRLTILGVDDDRYHTVIHPSVEVPVSCRVGSGSILLAHTTLTADVRVGRHVVIMPQAVLTHDDVVKDFATLCAGVTLGGAVLVGNRAYVGMNASVRQGVRIGEGATLGMGAVALTDVPDGQRWAGIPARALAPTIQVTGQPI